MTVPIGPTPTLDRTRVKVRVRPIAAPHTSRALRSVPISTASNACRSCGAKVTIPKRVYCDQCLPEQRRQQLKATIPGFTAAGPAKIAAMRAAGYDPTNTPEARQRHAVTASARRRAVLAWRDDGSLDGVDFRRDILPKIQGFPVRVIAEAMGCGISHASKVRGGGIIPHKRHWGPLGRLYTIRAKAEMP
jgi:hypothetical protein